MNEHLKKKQLMKILVGAAWIDGIIQAEERTYLRRTAQENGLSEDSEIQSLLSEIKPVNASQCYQWLEEYLGENYQDSDYEKLLEAISALIYSDGDVHTQEAKLLNHIQNRDPSYDGNNSVFDRLLKSVQKLYRQALDS